MLWSCAPIFSYMWSLTLLFGPSLTICSLGGTFDVWVDDAARVILAPRRKRRDNGPFPALRFALVQHLASFSPSPTQAPLSSAIGYCT